jgi:release factor glutamine methyltransferase
MTYEELWRRLAALYDAGEAKAIVRMVLDVHFGLSPTDVYCGKVTQLSANDTEILEKMMQRLERAEPVQYVLGKADFCGRTFSVAPGVLIPRPETEELCRWIIDSANGGERLLDIGTGSGCIAVTLQQEIAGATATAWDLSAEALDIARANAAAVGAEVTTVQQDALQAPDDHSLWDIIVSNPPYICNRERQDMERNVTEYEPPMALFVPDDDPLRFYRAIARYAVQALKPGGALFFEINPLYAADTEAMLSSQGYTAIETRRDMFGKQRFIKALQK